VQNFQPKTIVLFQKLVLLVHERILCGIVVTLREVVVDLVNGDAHVLQNLPEILTLMTEHYGAMVWVVFLNENVTIEAAHVLDTEDTNRTE
jgi:hypothetical protein